MQNYRNHKYFTQCQMQLGVTGVTGLKKCYFMVWTCHGFIVDEICFDSTLWEYLKQLYHEFYNHYLLSFIKINSIISLKFLGQKDLTWILGQYLFVTTVFLVPQ